jgi:hypothetical protein
MSIIIPRGKSEIYIRSLALSFPCLQNIEPLRHDGRFDPTAFMKHHAKASAGEQLAATFVVSMWDPAFAQRNGWKFDVMKFVAVVDAENRAAFSAWLEYPEWP